jgi:hypothetical protein
MTDRDRPESGRSAKSLIKDCGKEGIESKRGRFLQTLCSSDPAAELYDFGLPFQRWQGYLEVEKLLNFHTLATIAKAFAPLHHILPNIGGLKHGGEKIGCRTSEIALKGRIFARNKISVEFICHSAISALEREEAAVDKLAALH